MGSPVPPYQITAHDVLEAIKLGAREGTAQALKELFESGDAQVTLAAAVDISDRDDRELGEVSVTGPVDISDRPGRQLGEVTLSGQSVPLQTTGVYPEYRILSTDPKPDAAEVGVGAVVYEVDTQTVYMSDGTDWVMQ